AYAHSSAMDYAGIRYTPIAAGTPGLEATLKAGEATIEESRYGDYAATALDPHDNLTIWHVEEYAKDFLDGVTGWGTWISAIQITGAPTPPGDFSIAVSPSSRTMSRGGSTSYAVTVNAINGYSRAVTFTSLTGLPRGVTFGALPTSAPPGASFALTLSASRTVRRGTYTLILTATDAGITRSARFELRVR